MSDTDAGVAASDEALRQGTVLGRVTESIVAGHELSVHRYTYLNGHAEQVSDVTREQPVGKRAQGALPEAKGTAQEERLHGERLRRRWPPRINAHSGGTIPSRASGLKCECIQTKAARRSTSPTSQSGRHQKKSLPEPTACYAGALGRIGLPASRNRQLGWAQMPEDFLFVSGFRATEASARWAFAGNAGTQAQLGRSIIGTGFFLHLIRVAPVELRFLTLFMSSDASNPDSAGSNPAGSGSTGPDATNPDSASPGPTSDSSDEGPEGRAVTETTRCPACGRRFVGDYCPECGQEANPPASATGILEDFAREFFDIERGFLKTLRDLTFSPGQVLRAYLRGGRQQIMSPGRYLVAALLIQYIALQGLKWAGALASVTRSAFVESNGLVPDDAPAALQEAAATFLQQAESQEGRIVLYLLGVGILAVLLSQLFRDRLRRRFDAAALSSFLVGHAVLLETAAHVAWVPPARLLTEGPVSPVSPASFTFFFAAAFAVFLGYVGWATYHCFGPGWGSAAKGVLGAIWTQLELGALVGIAAGAYALWLAWRFGEMAPVGEVVLGLWSLCAAPFLLHAGCEAYYRPR